MITKRFDVCPLEDELVRLSDVFLIILFMGVTAVWFVSTKLMLVLLLPSVFIELLFRYCAVSVWLLVLLFSDSLAFLLRCCVSLSLLFRHSFCTFDESLFLLPLVTLPMLRLLSCKWMFFGGECESELMRPACAVEADAVDDLRLFESILLYFFWSLFNCCFYCCCWWWVVVVIAE